MHLSFRQPDVPRIFIVLSDALELLYMLNEGHLHRSQIENKLSAFVLNQSLLATLAQHCDSS